MSRVLENQRQEKQLLVRKITNGEIIYQGQDVTKPRSRKAIGYNKDVQMIFQDSMSSLNPKKRVLDIIAEPIRNFERLSDQEEKKKVKRLLDIVGDARRCVVQISS